MIPDILPDSLGSEASGVGLQVAAAQGVVGRGLRYALGTRCAKRHWPRRRGQLESPLGHPGRLAEVGQGHAHPALTVAGSAAQAPPDPHPSFVGGQHFSRIPSGPLLEHPREDMHARG